MPLAAHPLSCIRNQALAEAYLSRAFECIESLSAVTEKYADIFCRVHSCYSVNPAFVAEIGRFYPLMNDGERISIPEEKYTATRDELQRRIDTDGSDLFHRYFPMGCG